jgi:vacuolar-type H+-ATPase subunit C/Vma6
MGEYDYLNARVRAMGTELLTREFYDQILAIEGEQLLIDALLSSPYGPELREALAVLHGIEAVESALRRHVFATFAKLRSIAPEEPRRLLAVQFNQWDTANVLAVVRGKVNGADPEEILEGVLPAGEFDEAQLAELAGEPDLASVADALTTWSYRFAFELRRAIRRSLGVFSVPGVAARREEAAPEPDLAALESAVNRAYFLWALAQTARGDENVRLARRMLEMQIDLANVKAALDFLRHRGRGDELERFEPLPGGQLAAGALEEVAGAGSPIEAFEALEETYFAPGIEKGILAFGRAGSLGVMERFLEVVAIGAGCRLYRLDPLTIAVPLGFIWRKYNEFLNLRILLRGKAYRMPANSIREELLLV